MTEFELFLEQQGIACQSEDELEAAQWLYNKLTSPFFWRNYGYVPYYRQLEHQAHYFGRCGFEVPYEGHPNRPFFVNKIMMQLGATLVNCEIGYELVGVCEQVPRSVYLEYQTNIVGIVNEV